MTAGLFACYCSEPVYERCLTEDVLKCTVCLQRAKEYYEQALMQELKKSQELEQHIRLLENRLHHPDKECRPDKQVSFLSVLCTLLPLYSYVGRY